MGVLAVVDGGIDGNSPHGSGVSITVAVVVLSAVAAGPYEDGAESVASLKRIEEGAVTLAHRSVSNEPR